MNEDLLREAKRLAMDNYSTWGQWVVECYEDEELLEELLEYGNIPNWVDMRISIANARQEIMDTRW